MRLRVISFLPMPELRDLAATSKKMTRLTGPELASRPYKHEQNLMAQTRRKKNSSPAAVVLHDFEGAIKLMQLPQPTSGNVSLIDLGKAIFDTCWTIGHAGVISQPHFPYAEKLCRAPGNDFVFDIARQYLQAISASEPDMRAVLEMAVFLPLMKAGDCGGFSILDCLEVCRQQDDRHSRDLLRILMRVIRLPEFRSKGETLQKISVLLVEFEDFVYLAEQCLKTCIYVPRGEERLNSFHALVIAIKDHAGAGAAQVTVSTRLAKALARSVRAVQDRLQHDATEAAHLDTLLADARIFSTTWQGTLREQLLAEMNFDFPGGPDLRAKLEAKDPAG